MRSPRFIIVFLIFLSVFLIIVSVGYYLYSTRNAGKQSSDITKITLPTLIPATVYSLSSIPTPGPSRTRYTNTKYGYTFEYPTDWKLSPYEFQKVDTVHAFYQVQTGDAYPFDVGCTANMNDLDAQNWWKQNGHGTGIGFITLNSGVTAYLAVGRGQVGYQTYTLVHKHTACSFTVYLSNQAINAITDSVVNSFSWQ